MERGTMKKVVKRSVEVAGWEAWLYTKKRRDGYMSVVLEFPFQYKSIDESLTSEVLRDCGGKESKGDILNLIEE